MTRRRLVIAGVVGFYTLVTVWLTWPLAPRFATGLSGSADSLLNAWALGWSFHALANDPGALFDANIFAPRPDTLAYSEHLFGITALVWPVYALSGNLVLAYNTAFFAAFVLSGFGMFLLVRELTGNGWGALAAGTIFLAAPYHFQHVLQLQLVTYQWFPFVLWSLLRLLDSGKKRHAAALAVFALLQMLSCNYYAVYLVIVMAVFGVVLVALRRDLLDWSRGATLALTGVVIATVMVPFVLPYQRTREQGFFRRYEDVVQYSASPRFYVARSAFNDAPHWEVVPRARVALFPGFVALVLAALGLAARPKRWRLYWVFAIAITVVGVVLSFGPEMTVLERRIPLPYRFLQLYFPGFNGMRVPARFAVLALVGTSLLAGWGADAALRRVKRRTAIAGAILVAALLFDYQTSSLDRVFPEAPTIPEAHRWLANAPGPGAVLVLPIHEGEDIIHESLTMYYATAHFKPLVNGYSGWWPNDYWEVVGRLRHFPTSRILRFLLERAPVRYVVIHYGRIPEPRRRQLAAGMARYRERMPERFRMGEDVVYEILGGSPMESAVESGVGLVR